MTTSRNPRHRLLWAGLLASATLAGTSAFAQAPQMPSTAPATPPAAEAPASSQAKPQLHRADRQQRMERMRAHRAERLAALKQKLQLNPSQDSAWNSYAAAHQPPARPAGQARPDREAIAKMTTPQRLDLMQARQAERSAMFTKRMDATRSFYAALTPEQQKTFDAESLARFGPGGHHHHRGGPGHGPTPPAKS